MNVDEIKEIIKLIGFELKDGEKDLVYEKKYNKHNNYIISIKLNELDYTKSIIDYGEAIKYGRKTTQNLHQKENFVVLECVNRLLEKGYSPNEIVLEKDYPTGRNEKGQWLDILINKDGLPYYMIECKTFGTEYNNAKKDILYNGGQLLTYYTNDRDVKKVILYSSSISNNKIEYNSVAIDTTRFKGSNKVDIFNEWNKEFTKYNIFDYKTSIYENKSIGIKKEDLHAIKEDNTLYNEFARILRKYAVSDLTNAYNKLFNLLLCKIVDEDKLFNNINYEIQFQWKEEENAYDVLNKISNLYSEGIEKYLGIEITDYSTEIINESINKILDETARKELIQKVNELRFIKNNEFSFIEVFNKETFKENALILKEIIMLFSEVKIKYSDKQQFLGDFFERLLNIGIKQTEGQFFTPIPIANFIVNSIPFEKIINEKIEKDDNNFLPYAIDYACGAGHFLTEYMHRINKLLNDNMEKQCKTKLQKDNFKIWRYNYKWAKEFVYGIEKDYRLTKTSKVACFLNGDGDANIITGNGLDSFDSEKYIGKLHQNGEIYNKNNCVFDCCIANPPYSVQDFKDTLKTNNDENYGEKNFELYKDLGKNSDDIECLFMERTKQLVKENGYAGIVISNTFLTNSGIHQKTRELILNNFKIKGIVELGTGAFMATGTNTIVLFMKKREDDECLKLKEILKRFYKEYTDFNYKGIHNVIQHFIQDIYDDMEFEDYISIIKNKPTDKALESELCEEFLEDYISELEKKNKKVLDLSEIKKNKNEIDFGKLIKIEKQKLYMYLLNLNEKTIIVKAGSSKDEISNFLGYKFSKRRGDEGLKKLEEKDIKKLNTYSARDKIKSKLYNPNKLLDKNKVNYYIYTNFERDLSEEELNNKELKGNLYYYNFNDLIIYNENNYDFSINMEPKKKIQIKTKYNQVKIKSIADIIPGVTYDKEDVSNGNTNTKILTSDNITLDNKLNIKKVIFLNNKKIDRKKKLKKRDIFITLSSGSKSHLGKVAYIEKDTDFYAGGFMGIIRSKKVEPEYLYYMLTNKQIKKNIESLSNGNNINNLSGKLKHLKIPIPDSNILQKQLVDKLNLIELKKKELIGKQNGYKGQIKQVFRNINDGSVQKLSKVAEILPGSSPESMYYNREKDGLEFYQGMVEFDDKFIKHSNIWTSKITRESIKNDILLSVRAPVGPVNINPFEKICIGRGLFAIRAIKEKIDYYYLFLLLKYNDEIILDKSKDGLGFKSINKPQVSKLEIIVPSKNMQTEILEKIRPIEKQIEKIDEEIKELEQNKEKTIEEFLV